MAHTWLVRSSLLKAQQKPVARILNACEYHRTLDGQSQHNMPPQKWEEQVYLKLQTRKVNGTCQGRGRTEQRASGYSMGVRAEIRGGAQGLGKKRGRLRAGRAWV